jgi:hypothetical protein
VFHKSNIDHLNQGEVPFRVIFGKRHPDDELPVSSIVPIVMGILQTRPLIQPKKAATVTMMLTSASAFIAMTSAYLIQKDRELLVLIEKE